MTTTDFDSLEDGSRIRSTNPATSEVLDGTVERKDYDRIKVKWDNGDAMRIKRHEVGIYRDIYGTFEVLPPPVE